MPWTDLKKGQPTVYPVLSHLLSTASLFICLRLPLFLSDPPSLNPPLLALRSSRTYSSLHHSLWKDVANGNFWTYLPCVLVRPVSFPQQQQKPAALSSTLITTTFVFDSTFVISDLQAR
jgi:hypothetical protein